MRKLLAIITALITGGLTIALSYASAVFTNSYQLGYRTCGYSN